MSRRSKMQNRPMDFNVTVSMRAFTVSDSTFMNLPLIEFWSIFKKNIHNYLKRLLKHFFFQLNISVRLTFPPVLQPNNTLYLVECKSKSKNPVVFF